MAKDKKGKLLVKKIICVLIGAVVLAHWLTGCEGGDIASLMDSQTQIPARPITDGSEYNVQAQPNTPQREPGQIDIDLVTMSPTLVAAQVFWMMNSPGDFVGQVVRVLGTHATIFWEDGNMQLSYIVMDVDVSCCGEAFEFILAPHLIEAYGYPEDGAIIEIIGTFSHYTALGTRFHYIAVSDITIF